MTSSVYCVKFWIISDTAEEEEVAKEKDRMFLFVFSFCSSSGNNYSICCVG